MTQYLLTLCREYAVPIHPEQTQQVPAGGNVLADAGAFGVKTGLLPAGSATAVRMTMEQAS